MKKLIALGIMLSLAVSSWGQLIEVKSVSKVELPQGVTVQQAHVSPDCSYVVFSRLGGNELTRLDLATGAAKVLTDNGSSLQLGFSADGSAVVFRQNTFDKNHRRFTAVKSVNVASGAETTLVKPTRQLQGVAVSGQTVSTVEGGRMSARALKGTAVAERPVVSVDRGQLCVTTSAGTKVISPFGTTGNSYLWPSVSPDGSRILFYAAGYGTYSCRPDGSDLRQIGAMRAPVWASDSVVVGMLDENDGQFTTASRLVAASTDGTVAQTLTDPSVIAVLPSVADGTIVFSTPAGELYKMSITLK